MKARSAVIVNFESKVSTTVRNIARRYVVLGMVSAVLLAAGRMGFSQDQKGEQTGLPQLRTINQVTQLYVDDKPFLALGGELGNSTASDLSVLETAFQKCQRMNLNTIMLPVYWNLIEPEEGKFDFSLVQGAIDRARAHNLHLVYLWFGTWKNSMSCYAPGWVKRDTARFEARETGERRNRRNHYSGKHRSQRGRYASVRQSNALDQRIRFAKAYGHHGAGRKRDWNDSRSARSFGKVRCRLQKRGTRKAVAIGNQGRTGTRSECAMGKSRPQNAGHLERSFWNGSARRRSLFRLAVLDVCRKGGVGGQERVCVAHVCQCRAYPAGIQTGPISQCWAAAAFAGGVACRGAIARHDLPRHLLSKFYGMVRSLRCAMAIRCSFQKWRTPNGRPAMPCMRLPNSTPWAQGHFQSRTPNRKRRGRFAIATEYFPVCRT